MSRNERLQGLHFRPASIAFMRMKLTVSTLSCPDWDLPRMVLEVAAAGIAGIDFRGMKEEIDITRLPQFGERLDETLAMLRTHKLSMPCLNTSVTLVSPSPERWAAMLEEAQCSARLAGRTGTAYLRIFGGSIPKGLTADEGLHLGQRHLRQIIKICKTFGCQPLVETHDEWVGSTRMMELIHDLDPADVGVVWDIEHTWRLGEAAETARALRRYIRQVHIKDTVGANAERHPVLIGEGILPLADFAAVLREIGFDGWYSLEVEKRWDASAPEPEISLKQFSEYMKERWNR